MINYGEPTISNQHIKKVLTVLKKKNITQGDEVENFEISLAKKLKCKYCVVFSSGTAALHVAGKALGWKKNDIVICTPVTFVASCNSIIYNNASPYFVDIDLKDNNLDCSELEYHIKLLKQNRKKIKAVVLTELGGALAEWDKIIKLKKKYNFQILNDKCHSLGSKFKKKVSYSTDFCEIATVSFHAVKHITTGEGGAILTNNKKYYEYSKLLRSHAILKNKKKYSWKYQINEVGYNYRLTDFQSILGRYQLKDLDKKIVERNKISKFYDLQFKKFPFIKIYKNIKSNLNARHLYILKIDFKKFNITKESFFKKVYQYGIKLQQHYIPIYKFNYIKKHCLNYYFKFPNAEIYHQQSVSLPIHNNLKKKDLSKVVRVIKKILIPS
jgi:UDP-4-amino-4,6-dideoxy-L-N-acetyl-beta-L-altrosamine transaminase